MSINFDDALSGWSQTPADKKSNKENEALKEHIKTLLRAHKSQQRQLERILESISGEEVSEKLINELRWYIAQSEATFLRSKKTVNYINHSSLQIEADDKLEIYGRWLSNEYSLTKKKDEYILVLPPMVSQYKSERRLQEGRAIHLLVLYLLDEFYKREKNLEVFHDATIEFYHFIDKDMPERSVPDPDNVDIKKVIDSLHGFIIESDNLLHLDLFHYGILSDWPHTEVIIKRGKKAPIKTENSATKR